MINYSHSKGNFALEDYDKASVFSDFLPAIAGERGIPMWAFIVNRGQCLSSFGVKDKNGAISEFLPLNRASREIETSGFRTFIKYDGRVIEAFKSETSKKYYCQNLSTMFITEEIEGFNIEVKYTCLVEENIPALLRKVTIKNISNPCKEVTIIDGLAEILPYGVNDMMVKNMTSLMSSFTNVYRKDNGLIFKHNYSTSDQAKINPIDGGNFYISTVNENAKKSYIYDSDVLFGLDSTKTRFGNIKDLTLKSLKNASQSEIYKLPMAFTIVETPLAKNETSVICSSIGRVDNLSDLTPHSKNLSSINYYEEKFNRSVQIVEEVANIAKVKSSDSHFDEYIRYSFFDNLLRGGMPIEIADKVDYIYSRKHGDIEREYNFFVINPTFYSSGSGNFRDVNQNRRSDNFFFPCVKDYNIKLFYNLLQLNGYNPLVVEIPKYKLKENVKLSIKDKKILNIIHDEFYLGEVATIASRKQLEEVLRASEVIHKATFGEGYWTDHFTYGLDIIKSYLSIYPDKKEELLKDKSYKYFNIVEDVVNFSERAVKENDEIKCFEFLKKSVNTSEYLNDSKGNVVNVSLDTKLLALALIKTATLDRKFVGIEMEGGKPGWNDAMNGLPGLNGSNVPDAMELYQIVKFLKENVTCDVELMPCQLNLMLGVMQALQGDDRYNDLLKVREAYHNALCKNVDTTLKVVKKQAVIDLMTTIELKMKESFMDLAKENDGLFPTFLTYKITGEVENNTAECRAMPLFLEAIAKSYKVKDFTNATEMYNKTLKTELYDKDLELYKTSVPLGGESPDVGRCVTFHAGLYERESSFFHMHYKYLLGLLDAGAYNEYFKEFKRGLICRKDMNVYRRNNLQHSSFIVSSKCENKSIIGKGFQPRLSGANCEIISMHVKMFLGEKPFIYENKEVLFKLKPILSADMFDSNNEISGKFFGKTTLTYKNDKRLDTYKNAKVTSIEVEVGGVKTTFDGDFVSGNLARDIREGKVDKITAIIA